MRLLRIPSLVTFFLLGHSLSGAGELRTFENVTLVTVSWADGDSFPVRLEEGRKFTVRLYGVDTLESRIGNSTDARRLRAQRRYFGISGHGDSPHDSIELAKNIGEAAALRVRHLLEKPFTVHTAFADARGDPRYKRVYAFVTTSEGHDLATLLVREGLARAHGLVRRAPDGQSHDEYRESLRDAELIAARKSEGTWRYTDWESLSNERRAQRRDELEERIALGTAPPDEPVDVNKAPGEELTRIPGIGQVTAARMLDKRPFRDIEDLRRVRGIGPKTLESIRPWIVVNL